MTNRNFVNDAVDALNRAEEPRWQRGWSEETAKVERSFGLPLQSKNADQH